MRPQTWLLPLLCCACSAVHPPPTSTEACEQFTAAVAAFDGSLVRPPDAPPRADPVASPPLARQLLTRAEACFTARGIAVHRQGETLVVPRTEPLAHEVAELTDGAVVYSTAFFLEKPYAAAAFDKRANVLFLPHRAVRGELSAAVVHEVVHARSLSLLRRGPRLRGWLLENDATRPDALSLDELFAYAAVAVDERLTAPDRERSLGMARQYLQMLSDALADPSTQLRLELPREPLHAPTAAQRRALEALERCVRVNLPSIEACDGPTPD